MGTLEIKAKSGPLQSELKATKSKLLQRAKDLLTEVLNVYADSATVLAPKRSGKLKESIHIVQKGKEGHVTSDVKHYSFIVLGTKPHSIGSPVWIPEAGGWRYIGLSPAGKGKIHPGIQANDFMQEAFDKSDAGVSAKCEAFLDWIVS